MTPPDARPLDVVLFGATGFTGRLVADYLAQHAPGLRWAIAGRSRDKLEQVKRELASAHPALAELPVQVTDAADAPALARIAAGTRVVCTTVGPYAKHGHELAAACAEQGADYCDLTGEVNFIRASIDRNHERAQQTSARLVHCCGFDSIPSDLGVLTLAEHFRAQGLRLASAALFVGPMRGGVSGGTIASALGLIEEASRDREVRRLLGDPYALLPDRRADRGPDGSDQKSVRFDALAGEWTGPFVMAGVNTRVVRRSNALLGFPWGKDFRYREAMSFGRGPRGALRAGAFTAGLAAFFGAASVGPLRAQLRRVVPAPGAGPDKAKREAGFFRARIFGESDAAGGPPSKAVARVAGQGDPGYGATALMLGESARCLAETWGPGRRGGVLTPASALGMALVDRLRAAGMTFEVAAA